VLGEPLTITELADDLGLSATPVREALSRLAGEGLIEDQRGRGYFARRLDVADLVELYSMRRLYLVDALSAAPRSELHDTVPAAEDPIGQGEQLGLHFDRIIAQAGNRALQEAYRQTADRLAPAIVVEAQIFPVREELLGLLAAGRGGGGAVQGAIDALHEVRRQRAGDVVRALRARANISRL